MPLDCCSNSNSNYINEHNNYDYNMSVATMPVSNGQSSRGSNERELSNIKLEHEWTWWYLENNRNRDWQEMQNEVITVDTLDAFWVAYNHIKLPSQLVPGSDHSIFKKGILPMWEHPGNACGGRWVISLCDHMRSELDNMWLTVMLAVIGEELPDRAEICGVVASVRARVDKISIWTSNGMNENAILNIGYQIKTRLALGVIPMHYFLHQDAINNNGKKINPLYTI